MRAAVSDVIGSFEWSLCGKGHLCGTLEAGDGRPSGPKEHFSARTFRGIFGPGRPLVSEIEVVEEIPITL